jgi:hypothetical protein
MDVNSGRIVEDIESLPIDVRKLFTPVPEHLRGDAENALAGRSEVTVNLNEQNNLTAWAANVRKKQRTRTKIAKQSRKRNRK